MCWAPGLQIERKRSLRCLALQIPSRRVVHGPDSDDARMHRVLLACGLGDMQGYFACGRKVKFYGQEATRDRVYLPRLTAPRCSTLPYVLFQGSGAGTPATEGWAACVLP